MHMEGPSMHTDRILKHMGAHGWGSNHVDAMWKHMDAHGRQFGGTWMYMGGTCKDMDRIGKHISWIAVQQWRRFSFYVGKGEWGHTKLEAGNCHDSENNPQEWLHMHEG